MALSAFDQDLWSPFFGNGLSQQLSHPRTGEASVRGIPLDVLERADRFEIKADIPGVDKKAIKLSVDGDVLSISVAKSAAKEDKRDDNGVKFHRTERSSTFVRRSLRLPEHADLSKVTAKYVDGVLITEVPKAEEKARTRSVEIA